MLQLLRGGGILQILPARKQKNLTEIYHEKEKERNDGGGGKQRR